MEGYLPAPDQATHCGKAGGWPARLVSQAPPFQAPPLPCSLSGLRLVGAIPVPASFDFGRSLCSSTLACDEKIIHDRVDVMVESEIVRRKAGCCK